MGMGIKLPSFADPANLKVPEEPVATAIPDDIPIMQLADMVVRGKMKLSQPQMRLLIELLPYHSPKLAAQANFHFDGSFGYRLDKAIEIVRSQPMKLIEAQPVETKHPPVELKPFSRLRRRV